MLAPGIHDGIAADVYHADPCDVPSLSASVANVLVTQSPAHAKAVHPRLADIVEPEDESKFDIGTAAHAAMLQGEDIIGVCPFDDWRKKDAQAMRDELRAGGKIPLLASQAERVWAMIEAGRAQLEKHSAQPAIFTAGKAEQMLVWEDDHGVICRALVDWLRDDHATIDDYKTTKASAHPAAWVRTAFAIGADVQVAFYLRGMQILTGARPAWRYVVQETYPPYALSVVDLSPSALALGEAKVQRAIDLWAACRDAGSFDAGYDRRVASIEVPTWAEMQWLDREDVAA